MSQLKNTIISNEINPITKESEANRILMKYSDRVPLIIKKHENCELPQISKKKFLVPNSMLCAELKYIITKYLNQELKDTNVSEKSIYLYIMNTNYSPKSSDLLSEVYHGHKADDNFLYLNYSSENTLG